MPEGWIRRVRVRVLPAGESGGRRSRAVVAQEVKNVSMADLGVEIPPGGPAFNREGRSFGSGGYPEGANVCVNQLAR